MENITPKCINNNMSLNVCNVNTCKAIPFLCINNKCSCYSQHQSCSTTLKWESLRQSFLNKLKNSSLYDQYLIQINDLYKWVIKQIEKSFTGRKNISDSFGFSHLERKVYQKLRQKKFCDLTGQLISKVVTELMQDKRQFQVWSIDQEKKEIQKQTMTLVQILQRLIKQNNAGCYHTFKFLSQQDNIRHEFALQGF